MLRSALLLVVLLAMLFSCSPENKSSHESQKNQVEKLPSPTSTVEKPTAQDEHVQIKNILQDYYTALENEDEEIGDFYAPIIHRFYSADSFTQQKVSQSLLQSFKNVENRKVELDWNSLIIRKQESGFVATFKGSTTFDDAKSGAKKTSGFYNQVTFDEDLRILRYENAEEAKRLQNQSEKKTQTGTAGLSQVVFAVSRALSTGKVEALEAFLHPTKGYYLITQPGAFSVPYKLSNHADLGKKAPWLTKGYGSFCKNPKQEALPDFDCETHFSKKGCYFTKLNESYLGLTELMKALTDAEVTRYEKAPLQVAESLQKLVSHQLIDTQTAISLFFGKIGEKWYLLIIDTATYDCSA